MDVMPYVLGSMKSMNPRESYLDTNYPIKISVRRIIGLMQELSLSPLAHKSVVMRW